MTIEHAQEKIAALEKKLANLKEAAKGILAQNDELKADIAKIVEYGEVVFEEIKPFIPKNGQSVDVISLAMKAMPKVQDKAFIDKIYKGAIEPLLELHSKYKT